MEIKITDYLPAIDEIGEDTLADARQRILDYLHTKEEFKTVDMRPNSVFGDLVLSPLSHILAAFETGTSRMFSDLDLSNVAAGTIYNCDFVKKYLDNFGQGQVYEYPSTGVVQLQFSSPDPKLVDAGSKFLFEGDNGIDYIYEMIGIVDYLSLQSPYGDIDLNNPNEKRLIRVSENRYVVNVPVSGPAGVGVNDGTNAATDIAHSDLISSKALGDFDRGTLPENIMELALKVQKTFYSSTLNNRTGAVSFLLQTFPELRGVSPVITGDVEMIRDKENVLGVKEGKMDLYFKSRSRYLVNEQEIKLTYNTDMDQWMGSLDFLEPPVWIDEIRRTNSLEKSNIIDIYGRSIDSERCPELSCAYSKFEDIGFSVEDNVTTDDSNPENFINGVLNEYVDGQLITYTLQGQYYGNVYSKDFERNLKLHFYEVFEDTDEATKLRAFLSDDEFSESCEVIFIESSFAGRGIIENTEDWSKLLNGLDLKIEHNSDPFSAIMLALVGKKIDIKVVGRGGSFVIKYRYDPNHSLVDKIIGDTDVAPVNVDVVAKNFLTCYVYELIIDYRKQEGQNVDLIKAKEEIVNYVNKLTYPHVYEEYIIAEILLFYGAEGVQKIRQNGQFFKSLANKYEILEDGETVTADINHPYTSDLQAPETPGLGVRNINYILDAADVKFNAIII
jgi:hypothetical protein